MTTGAPSPTYPARPRRSRLRTFLPLGIAAWLVLEIWLLLLVADATSGLVVFLLLVAGLVLGSVVIKRAGRRAFQNLNEALQRGGTPAPSGGGNGLMMLGGLLLMLPGLISDAIGLVLLVPPVQKVLGRYAERTVEKKLRQAGSGSLGDAFQQARIHRPDGKVVQGEVIRDEPRDTPEGPRPPLTH
ncbi:MULTISPECIES: FxsA family membrane protein [Streptomyces]|uniref:FxsA family membrane protein n=1 Tax=Streptomyces fuscus TaxID=3048495 RepID=A0ABT7J9N2_9ACTN|nr:MULTISPECIES: FxsA family membrane protein [Streptomyces]MCM1975587.1 FxsA family protein [Streptomyces sp. G1]MDL2080233.1 FxsA family membrane protein [Streptomyces fuscus]